MCYIYTSVNVCFECRVGFERRHLGRPRPEKCPQCGGKLHHMGAASSNFKPPKKRNKKQWIKVRRLYEAGVRFGGGCCARSDPNHAPLPKRLSQVDHFLATDERVQSRKSEGERLLAKISQAGGKNK